MMESVFHSFRLKSKDIVTIDNGNIPSKVLEVFQNEILVNNFTELE